MIKEKSCGAVIYYEGKGTRLYLIEKMQLGHYSLCKGHVENNETEIETALREIKEETNLDVEIDLNFRKTINYSPKTNTIKEVVYYIAKSFTNKTVAQQIEVSQIYWKTYEEAYELLTYESDKDILKSANNYLSNKTANTMDLKNVNG